MQHFAVVGNPIAHSRSPEIHVRFAAQTGIALSYQRLLAPLDAFEAVVVAFFAGGGRGLNVTVPFKEQAFQLCGDRLTDRARVAGAVNTLWQHDGQLHGDNTDGEGLVNDLKRLGWPLGGKQLVIVGAGGATRGVILPLLSAGVASITIANRTLSRASELVDDLAPYSQPGQLSSCALSSLQGHVDLVINATSASLGADGLQLPESLRYDHAYEMAYGKPSAFLEAARLRGVPVADGKGMLVGQAAEAFRVWHGVLPQLFDL